MRLFVFIAFLMANSAWANPAYFNQPLHERILFGEHQKGYYVMSFYNQTADVVRFSNCYHGLCRPISRDFRHEDLPALSREVINKLERVRSELISYIKNHPFRTLVSGQSDLEVLNHVIEDLKAEGLSNWILLRKSTQAAASFGSEKLYADVSEAISSALQKPLPRQPIRPESSLEADSTF